MTKQIKQKAFTLVEMMVVLFIATILIAVIIFNYRDADSKLIMRNIAYEVSLTIRQAQTFGLGVRGAGESAGFFNIVPYGVQFRNPNNEDTKFFLFQGLGEGDILCNDDDGTACDNSTDSDVVDTLELTQGVRFVDICWDSNNDGSLLSSNGLDGNDQCLGDTNSNYEYLTISFQRPNPDATLLLTEVNHANNPLQIDRAAIVLQAENGARIPVTVTSLGQINVENIIN